MIITTLDTTARAIAWAISKAVPAVRGAGVTYWPADLSFIDAWREPGGYTVRLGRLELVVDLQRQEGPQAAAR